MSIQKGQQAPQCIRISILVSIHIIITADQLGLLVKTTSTLIHIMMLNGLMAGESEINRYCTDASHSLGCLDVSRDHRHALDTPTHAVS